MRRLALPTRKTSEKIVPNQEFLEKPPQPLSTPVFPNVVDFTAAHCSSRPAIHLLSRQWPPQPDSSHLQRSICRASSDRDLWLSQQLQHQQHPPLRRGRTPRGELRGVHCQVRYYAQWAPRALLSMFLHSRNDAVLPASEDRQFLTVRCQNIDMRRSSMLCKMSLSFRYGFYCFPALPTRVPGYLLIVVRSEQRNLNNAFAYDLVPSPSVLTAALKAARRVNDFPTAVRIFEGMFPLFWWSTGGWEKAIQGE
jgi:hypothetical protein